jgi:2-methylisocitrate lyase-like PEP mutase family enzyme
MTSNEGSAATPAQRLRALLAEPGVVQAPGCYDAVSARLVAQAGFRAAHLSGAIASAVGLGLPDLGYLHGSDVAAVARRVTSVAGPGLPLIADADTGYGNALHVRRTVEQYREAGVAGLHLEDQDFPKRCGHMAGKSVIEGGEAVAKVRAAVEADTGLVIIARTDAMSVIGLDAAIERAKAFADAGADLVFIEGVTDPERLSIVHDALPDAGLVVNVSEADPKLRPLAPDVLAEYGVKLAIYPVAPLLAAAHALRATYAAIRDEGNATAVPRLTWDELTDLLGLPELLELEERYS